MRPLTTLLAASLATALCNGPAFAQSAPVVPTSQPPRASAAPAAAAQRGDVGSELGELVTDRPDFTESAEVAGRGVLQVETGFTFEGDRTQGVKSRAISTPAVLARIGLTRNVELRLGGEGFLRGWTTTPGVPAVAGYSDFEVGAKVKLIDRALFDFAVIPAVSVPTNDANFSSGTFDSTVKFAWATSLPRDFALSGNVNLAWLSDVGGRYAQQAVSVSLAHDLIGGWGSYWEAYTFAPMERGLGTGTTLNAGITRGLGRHMQVDFEAGRGVSRDAPDWFFGMGFVARGLFTRGR